MTNSGLNCKQLMQILWSSKWLLLGVTGACILSALAATYFLAPQYRAVTILAPTRGVWDGTSLSGANRVISRINNARLLDGIPVDSMSLRNAEAIGILRSRVLAAELIRKENLLPVIFSNHWNKARKTWKSRNPNEQPTIWQGVRYFSEHIRRVSLDSSTGLVSLSITWKNPKLAAKWAEELVALANQYARTSAMRRVKQKLVYFNRELTHTSVVQHRQVLFALIRSELDREMMDKGSRDYALRVIDPPAIPVVPQFPRPLELLAFGIVVGVILSTWLISERHRWPTDEREANIYKLRNLVPSHLNPMLVGLASVAGGISLTLFPPHIYRKLIGEPDLMFLNWQLLSFLGLCISAFLIGNRFSANTTGKALPFENPPEADRIRRQRMAVAVALAASILGAVVAGIFVRDARGYISALTHGGAQAIRASALASLMTTGFAATNILPLGFPLLLWAVGNAGNEGNRETSRSLISARRVIYGSVAVYTLCCVITLSRSLLMPFLLAILVVLSGTRWNPRGINVKKLIVAVGGTLTTVFALFLIIAYFRSGSKHSPIMMLTGYLPASYNRLAAALSGRLVPSISDVPYYSFRFLWYPPLLHRVFSIPDMGRSFGWPIPERSLTSLFAEFRQVSSADLNPMFIWPTAFGYVFYDFGWWSPIYFVVIGYLAHRLWQQFTVRTAYGLILYAYLLASILLWSTDNFLALPEVWVMVGVAVTMRIWERRSQRERELTSYSELRHYNAKMTSKRF